jgi:hypothetical protein
MRGAVLAAAVVVLGCNQTVAKGAGDCGAAGLQGLIGQSRNVLAAMTFPAGTRVITPGMAITRDYRPARLNIDVDANGEITRLWCG